MRKQLPVMPKFRISGTNKKFNTLQEAAMCVNRLTLDNEYILYWINDPQHVRKSYRIKANEMQKGLLCCRKTMFKEIEAVSDTAVSDILNLLNKKPKKETISEKELGIKLAQALVDYIESSWDSSKTNVMSHSSGYDSRIISWILKKLVEKNGVAWIGDIKFICFQPEIPQFLKLMDYMQWGPEYITLVKPDDSQLDYFADAVNFENIGKYCNDANRIGTYSFGYVLEKEIEKLNGEIEIISGLWSDEVLKRSIWDDLAYLTVRCLHDIHFEWGKHDYILPFCSSNFLEIYTDYHTTVSGDNIKKAIINSFDKDLVNFENYRFEYFEIIERTGTHPVYVLSDKTRSSMQKAYNKSWYVSATGRSIKIPGSIHNKHVEWKDYTKAAVCEYLIKNNCSIKYN